MLSNKRYAYVRRSAAFLCLAIALASGPAAAQSPAYRVDQATAILDGRYLVVRVKGAAKTGGWTHPRLVERRAGNPHNIQFVFMATPPGDSSAVVQQLVPLRVSLKTRAPDRPFVAVKIVSETNTVTAQIIPKVRPQRTARE